MRKGNANGSLLKEETRPDQDRSYLKEKKANNDHRQETREAEEISKEVHVAMATGLNRKEVDLFPASRARSRTRTPRTRSRGLTTAPAARTGGRTRTRSEAQHRHGRLCLQRLEPPHQGERHWRPRERREGSLDRVMRERGALARAAITPHRKDRKNRRNRPTEELDLFLQRAALPCPSESTSVGSCLSSAA